MQLNSLALQDKTRKKGKKKYKTSKTKDLKDDIKENITDNRQKGKITYKVWDIIITVFLAIICKCNDLDEEVVFAKAKYEYLKKYLKMTGGIPTQLHMKVLLHLLIKWNTKLIDKQ